MSVGQILFEALESLSGNKLRSGLTILGIVIGVAAVIAMLAVGQGAQNSITGSINGIGTNVLFVFSGNRMGPGRNESATRNIRPPSTIPLRLPRWQLWLLFCRAMRMLLPRARPPALLCMASHLDTPLSAAKLSPKANLSAVTSILGMPRWLSSGQSWPIHFLDAMKPWLEKVSASPGSPTASLACSNRRAVQPLAAPITRCLCP
jgi:hypothetical protein